MCFDILPRVLLRAFPPQVALDPSIEAVEEDDRRVYLRGKLSTAVHHVSSERSKMATTLLSWTAEPCDHLWQRLQYLDARSAGLFDLQVESQDPFGQCAMQLSYSFLQLVGAGPLALVFSLGP